jgi:hypothetical protein
MVTIIFRLDSDIWWWARNKIFKFSSTTRDGLFLKTSSSVICLINIGFCLGATQGLVLSAWTQHTCVVWIEHVLRRGMFGPNMSFGVQTTSMQKFLVFGALRFSEFRIRDCVPVPHSRRWPSSYLLLWQPQISSVSHTEKRILSLKKICYFQQWNS